MSAKQSAAAVAITAEVRDRPPPPPPVPDAPPAPPAGAVPPGYTDAGFYVGVDLGQAADWTAIAVVRRFTGPVPPGKSASPEPPHFHVPHLERVPRGTPYPDVVQRVRAIVKRPELQAVATVPGYPVMGFDGRGGLAQIGTAGDTRHLSPPKLVVDATGVGRPVVDLLRKDGLSPVAITITGGDAVSRDGSEYRVPKRDLVGALQVLLQSGRLKVAGALPMARVLTEELLRFRVKINLVTAHDSYGAWREGDHDDLVLALAIAVWYALNQPAPPRIEAIDLNW